ncbi:MAG: DegT/DnrJ/EryC1/StrS family aminotransferase [Candidatus Hydrogenedentes bacterium]|nr:DegT/DnrJ/EryC1/StrS family aminotransferase [Candidatus Hydrogenedentota bacterium]
MQVGFYGHVRQYHNVKGEIDAAISEVLESGQYVMGPALARFEKELAAFHGTKYAVGVNSGTDTLWLCMMALGIGPGDEVITTTNTFFATAEAIWIAGATAVFVDSEPKTNNIDVTKIEAAITPKTKAIVPVHLYGQCAEMDKIAAIAKKHNLYVIEDNAQAIDAAGDTFKIGELSDAASVSFIIQKNLGCFGDGGALVTNNEKIASEVKRLRNHGSTKRSVHTFGFNSRLDDIHAAVLSVKLKHIHEWNNWRQKHAERYTKGLQGLPLTLPYVKSGYRHVFHLYVIETLNGKRDQFIEWLNKEGVDAKCHYPIAIHQQEGYPWGKQARVHGSVANSERNAASCISLPMFPELKDEEVDYVIAKVQQWCKANA